MFDAAKRIAAWRKKKEDSMSETPSTPKPAEDDGRNKCFIDNNTGLMTVQIHLHAEDAPAKCLGSLEIAKDMVKQYLGQRQAIQQTGKKKGIIVPGIVGGNRG